MCACVHRMDQAIEKVSSVYRSYIDDRANDDARSSMSRFVYARDDKKRKEKIARSDYCRLEEDKANGLVYTVGVSVSSFVKYNRDIRVFIFHELHTLSRDATLPFSLFLVPFQRGKNPSVC